MLLALAGLSPACAEDYALHGQATFLDQYHPAFASPYQGPHSMSPKSLGDETFDATLYAGLRLWDGAEAWADGEVDQGFGLSGTLGAAAFPSAEAYKVGADAPYARLQRLFLRQTFDLGGAERAVAPDANQLGGGRTDDAIIVTAGKISVGDIFDVNSYAHDPRQDFMNWAVVDTGTFDYAADAWGYSYGVAVEADLGDWSARAGLFDLSRVPNDTELETRFAQFELDGEIERRFTLLDRPGKIRLLGFLNRGRMGRYRDALALAQATGAVPDTAAVRRYASRTGLSINLEQAMTDSLGFFLRAGFNDGSEETYEFTDINRALSFGLSLKGDGWGRSGDTLGAGVALGDISGEARRYLAAGGLGLLIGDGRLDRYGAETALETYYRAKILSALSLTLDAQLVVNPAYNADRGPIPVLSARLHAAF